MNTSNSGNVPQYDGEGLEIPQINLSSIMDRLVDEGYFDESAKGVLDEIFHQ